MDTAPRPYVRVTLQGPHDGGDFGPHTPGTRTSGLQEALDWAHRHCRDVYVFGGRGGMHGGEGVPDNVYTLDETLRIPWSQDFRMDGGNYVLQYRGTTGHAVTIDSQMNCRYKLGLIVSGSPDAAVAVRPVTPGPDDFGVITASVFDFSAIVSAHPQGTGLLLDSTHGPIIHSVLFAEETNTQGTAVYVTDAGGRGGAIRNNRLRMMFGNQHHSFGGCTGLRLGDPGSRHIAHNELDMTFLAPQGVHFDPVQKRYVATAGVEPTDTVGALIHAQENRLTLDFSGRRGPGQDVVFEADARDNTLYVHAMPNGVTNRARVPTNRIVTAGRPQIDTPPVPASGAETANASPYTVQVLVVSAGAVQRWSLTPGQGEAQVIEGGLFAGQAVWLEPGDRMGLHYAQAPTWRWLPVRT